MKYSVGVDIGGTNVAVGIVNTEGLELIGKKSFRTLAPRAASEICCEIVETVRALADELKISLEEVGKIGVATPGVVKDNVVAMAYNLGWDGEPLGSMLSELTGKPVYVANDANVAAYAEAVAGAGKGAESLVAVTLGTGVGGGIICDGKIWEGFNGFAAELGHITVEKDGRACACGHRGCLEAYCSATALIKDTKLAMENDKNSLMWTLASGNLDAVNGRTAFSAAKRGDKTAMAVVDSFIDYLATGVASAINLIQPEVVCIGGGISGEGDALLVPLNKKLEELAFGTKDRKTKVTVANFKNDAGIIGAALLGKKEI